MPHLRDYLFATRPFSYTASVIPALLGVAVAAFLHAHSTLFSVHIVDALLAIFGCIIVHSVSNLVNDFADYRSGLDSDSEFGKVNFLVSGILSPAEMKREIIVLFACALAIGIYFSVSVGLSILLIVVFGAMSAFFYTAPPFALKYRGLGDIQVALSFGILMTLGTYLTQASAVTTPENILLTLLISLPVTLLANAILHANNHRDKEDDERYQARTLATRLSEIASYRVQLFFVLFPYFLTFSLIAIHIIPIWCALVAFSFPLAVKSLRVFRGKGILPVQEFRLVVKRTAAAHAVFGILYIAGFLVHVVLG